MSDVSIEPRNSPLAAVHEAAGATLTTWEGWRIPARFGEIAAEIAATQAGCTLTDLAHVGVADITGEDCRRFCNGMFTNNLKRLQLGQGNRNALADLKGRILAMSDVYCIGTEPDHFVVTLEGRDYTWLFERLDRYIIMDDVELEDIGVAASVVHLQGPGVEAVLAGAGLPVPEAENAVAPDSGVRVLRRPRTASPGFDLLIPHALLADTWAALTAAGATPVGLHALEAARVSAGRPRFPVDVGEKRFAHELGMRDELLAFDKGCYLGQEVINRMDTMGRVNKRLVGLTVDGDWELWDLTGAEALLDGKVVGLVTSAAALDGRSLGLGVLRNPAIEAGKVVLRGPAGEVEAAVSWPPFAHEQT